MYVPVAGLPIEITPDGALSASEIEAIEAITRMSSPMDRALPAWSIEVVTGQPWEECDVIPEPGGPAAVSQSSRSVFLKHNLFRAELVPNLRTATLTRNAPISFPLEATIRTAACCHLPLVGGVALHAAGIIIDGKGVVFFGPSGAGKTTLSRCSPYPVVSDELVAVCGPEWTLRSTGFWGELDGAVAEGDRLAPLVGVVQLDRARTTEIVRLQPARAYRRLLDVLVLPPEPELWRHGCRELARLVDQIPAWRLAWSPERPPWVELAEAVGITG